MKIMCILNPTAGRGKAKEKWRISEQELYHQGIDITTRTTFKSGDATDLARRAIAEGFQIIIVAGGDGTVNEVIGVAAKTDVQIAIAPFGTGNDLARGIGISTDPVKWAKGFPSFRPIKVDLGLLNNQYFGNQAGFGFDAQVAQKVNSGIGFLRGKAAYLASIVVSLLDFEPIEVEITVDGKVMSKKVILASFANNSYVGGGLRTVPMADLCDGYLEMFILEAVSRWEFLKSFPLILKGTHVNHPAVSFYKGKHFSIRSAAKQYAHVDGEIQELTSLEVKVNPKCLSLLVPPKFSLTLTQ